MIRTLLIMPISALLIGCRGGNYEKADPHNQTGKEDTVAIYWEPIHRDSIKTLIKDHISFQGDDTLKHLPSDRDLTLKFDFTSKMKEYMKYGKMIVRPYDSSVFVERIDNWSFKLRVNKPIDGWKISMFYEYSFEKPYFFSYIHDGVTYRLEPNDTILLFLRSELTKPGDPWDYY